MLKASVKLNIYRKTYRLATVSNSMCTLYSAYKFGVIHTLKWTVLLFYPPYGADHAHQNSVFFFNPMKKVFLGRRKFTCNDKLVETIPELCLSSHKGFFHSERESYCTDDGTRTLEKEISTFF